MTDPVAESHIFSECYLRLRRFAAVVGPDECDPDDLLMEAVTRTLRRHRLDELDEPAAYLRRTILNLASNERRGFAVRRTALRRLVAGRRDQTDDYPSDLDDLRHLSAAERAVLYLSEVEGYRFAEIGQMLGCTEAAARKRAMKGRRRLYGALVEEVARG
ncbi:MAG TPA: sigma-70 family RNA polymerase sigma factor [Acidimicrobiia bacterium]|jgi:RNA polymerase sigma factor (sigma-70 family)|nr:sigma-70 family RNA polymerase sigma factor [Acidimicrobiia bacterium]